MFLEAGSFEGYISVFQKVFGNDVDLTFTVPSAGKLVIDIQAQGLIPFDLAARKIVENEYVFDKVVDQDDNQIIINFIKGLNSQSDVEIMLNELVPQGVWTDINLTLGGS